MKLNSQPKLWEIPTKLNWIEFIALSISAAASTFGLYTILEPLINKQYQLFALLAAFVGFFILIDRMRRGGLVRFLNSQLSQLVESYMSGSLQLNGKTINITPTKTKWFSGLLGGVLTIVIMGADIFGGYSINATIKDKLTEYKINSNVVYQKEVSDLASGRTALESYNIAMEKWNKDRAEQLKKWEEKNDADKKKWEARQAEAYKSCDASYPASKHYFKKNRECKSNWDKNNKFYNLSKPAEPLKPVMIASGDEANATKVIGSSIATVSKQAEEFAEPFAKGFFMLYVVLSLILNGLVLRAIFDAYAEMSEDIQQDPSLYKNAFEHWQIVRRAERHGISENKQKEETETMNIRVNLSSKLTDLQIKGELKKAAIKLKQHQIIETGGYGAIINHLRGQGISEDDISDMLKEFEDEDVSKEHNNTQQPKPVKIPQRDMEQKEAAKLDNTNPIGFKIEKSENVTPATKKPTFEKIEWNRDIIVSFARLDDKYEFDREDGFVMIEQTAAKILDKSSIKKIVKLSYSLSEIRDEYAAEAEWGDDDIVWEKAIRIKVLVKHKLRSFTVPYVKWCSFYEMDVNSHTVLIADLDGFAYVLEVKEQASSRPVGFKATKPVVNAVFDGEDLKIATELLLTGLKVGDKVMNNTQLRDAFKYSEAKGTMALNEVGSFVKKPLANIGVLQENSGKAYTVAMELEDALELLASKGMIHA